MISNQPHAEPIELQFSLVAEAEAPPEITKVGLEALSRSVLLAESAVGHWDLTVAIVGDGRLQTLHREFMGIDAPTDIMTFPADDSGEGRRGGELVISVDQARTQAGAWGFSPAEEIRFLVVHGILHLLGWRDDSAEERDRMLERQQALIDRWQADEGDGWH